MVNTWLIYGYSMVNDGLFMLDPPSQTTQLGYPGYIPSCSPDDSDLRKPATRRNAKAL